MNNKKKTKQEFEARPDGRRGRGSPRKEWDQHIGEIGTFKESSQENDTG